MAIAIDCRSNHPGVCAGTLAGGADRRLSPGRRGRSAGSRLGAGRNDADGRPRRGRQGPPRVSDGQGALRNLRAHQLRAAFAEGRSDRVSRSPVSPRRRGTVAVVDLAGKKTTLTSKWASEGGLAWSPTGDEVWFTATEAGANRSLYGVTLAGQAPGRRARARGAQAPRRGAERPRAADAGEPARRRARHARRRHARARHVLPRLLVRGRLTPDAKTLLFDEEGEAGGANYTVFLRKSDRSPVVRLGEGNAMAISPDGRWALSMLPTPNSPFILLPTGTGDHLQLAAARSEPGAGRDLASRQQEHRVRRKRARAPHPPLHSGASTAASPRPISPEGIVSALPGFAVIADGKSVAAIGGGSQGACCSRSTAERLA